MFTSCDHQFTLPENLVNWDHYGETFALECQADHGFRTCSQPSLSNAEDDPTSSRQYHVFNLLLCQDHLDHFHLHHIHHSIFNISRMSGTLSTSLTSTPIYILCIIYINPVHITCIRSTIFINFIHIACINGIHIILTKEL